MQPRSADPAAKLRGRFPPHRRYATLRWKTLLIVAATLVGLLVIVDDIYNLDLMNASYAIWDDTYAFVEVPNQEYIDNNYYDDFFTDNRLNLVLIVDRS